MALQRSNNFVALISIPKAASLATAGMSFLQNMQNVSKVLQVTYNSYLSKSIQMPEILWHVLKPLLRCHYATRRVSSLLTVIE